MSLDIRVFIGRQLRLVRKIKGYSQERLGNSIHVSYQQMQKYESGMNRISSDDLWDIAKELEVSLLCFFPDSASEKEGEFILVNDPETICLMQMFYGMHPEMKKAFIHIGQSMVKAFPLSAKMEAMQEETRRTES